jgi:CHU_C Type IX secretion signal domain
MGFFTRKYRLILIFLIGGFLQVKAQTSDSVNIRCVSVDSAGDVTLTWVLPSGASLATDGWQSFNVLASLTNTVGSYSSVLITPSIAISQTSVTIPAAYLPWPATTQQVYFYISTANSNTGAYNSNIASSIFLSLLNTQGGGVAQLYWNSLSSPLPQGSSQSYQIWREYNYTWALIGTTQSLSYWDTITYCDSTILKYQVQIADSNICTSTSNIAGGIGSGKFISQIAPPMVVMDTLSVTPGNGVDITWKKSNKNNVIGYIIYIEVIQNNGYVFTPLDTVYGINTDSLMNYLNGGNPSDSTLRFGVAAIDNCGKKGAISNPQNTLFLTVTPDICLQTNNLKWNAYENLAGNLNGDSIGGYRLFRSVNNAPYQLLASLDNQARTYTDSNLSLNEYTCYYVQVYDLIHADTTASSNIVCDRIQSPSLPKNNYLRTASVILNTSSIQIVGYIDSLSGAGYYAFQRSLDSANGFSTIYTMNAPMHTDSIGYVDNTANPDVYSYSYRILTLDSCNKTIDSTNIGRTMLLLAVGQPEGINTLTWNDYGNWYAGPAYYSIYRSIDGINYSPVGSRIKYTHAGQNSYTDNVGDITDGQGTFYYYIKAVEDTNATYPYPFIDTSFSNIAKAYQAPTVFIPDAFCPTGKNKIFMPVGVYISSLGYDLSILNRWGDLLFESKDPSIGWDGTYKGGKVVQQGVYVYLLTYTSSRGEYFQQKGTVTLIK